MKVRVRYLVVFLWYRFVGFFFRLFRIHNEDVIVENYYGKGYGDNAKYIVERMLEEGKVNIYWLLTDMSIELPKYISPVKRGTLKELLVLSRSKVIISNCRMHAGFRKRKKQIYIQTWHGSLALKKIEGDVVSKLGKEYIKSAINDSNNASLFISNSKWCTEMYRRAFWYKGFILECGSPRLDGCFSSTDKTKRQIREKVGIGDQTVIMYAPTYRNSKTTEVYSLNYQKIKRSFEMKFKCPCVILMRFHPLMDSAFVSEEQGVINVSKYPDMYELLEISDIVITDYSSIMFEAAFLKIPVFLFAPDIEKYSEERGWYFQIEELPFPLGSDNEQMIKHVESYKASSYYEKVDKFLEPFGIIEDGHASERIVNYLKEQYGFLSEHSNYIESRAQK